MPDACDPGMRSSILGRYVVEIELGQGGMGVVYQCLDRVGGVKVAVKGLPPEVSHSFGLAARARRRRSVSVRR